MNAATRTLLLAALGLGALALTFSLGQWQTRRAAQKLALDAQWDAAERAAPVALDPAAPPAAAELPRRVRVSGEFVFDKSVWLDNRQLDARPGYWVLTPLRADGGGIVVVNRGWAPRGAVRDQLPPVGAPAGRVTVEGLALAQVPRLLELGSGSNAATLPGIWQNLDLAHYAQASGLAVAPLVIQQTSELADGLQRRWARPASGVDRHRGYALQWYGLSLLIALLGLFYGSRAWRARLRLRSAG